MQNRANPKRDVRRNLRFFTEFPQNFPQTRAVTSSRRSFIRILFTLFISRASYTGTAKRSRLPTDIAVKDRTKQSPAIAISLIRVVFHTHTHRKKKNASQILKKKSRHKISHFSCRRQSWQKLCGILSGMILSRTREVQCFCPEYLRGGKRTTVTISDAGDSFNTVSINVALQKKRPHYTISVVKYKRVHLSVRYHVLIMWNLIQSIDSVFDSCRTSTSPDPDGIINANLLLPSRQSGHLGTNVLVWKRVQGVKHALVSTKWQTSFHRNIQTNR